MRIVFEEHGFPRELVTPADFARAVQDGSVRSDTEVTVYRDETAPAVVRASAVGELRPLLGLSDAKPAPEDGTAPPTMQPATSSETRVRPVPSPVRHPAQGAAPLPPAQRFDRDFAQAPVAPGPAPATTSADARSARTADSGGSDAGARPRRGRASPSTPTTALPFVPLAKYADFSGRASRAEFWQFTGMAIFAVFLGVSMSDAIGGLLLVALALPSLAVSVRRLHDANITGWAVLTGLVPYVGWLIMLVMLLLAGTPKPNRFGEVPRGAPIGAG